MVQNKCIVAVMFVCAQQEDSRAVVMAIKVTQGSHIGPAVVVCWRTPSVCAASSQALTVDMSELWNSDGTPSHKKTFGIFIALKCYDIHCLNFYFFYQQACL